MPHFAPKRKPKDILDPIWTAVKRIERSNGACITEIRSMQNQLNGLRREVLRANKLVLEVFAEREPHQYIEAARKDLKFHKGV